MTFLNLVNKEIKTKFIDSIICSIVITFVIQVMFLYLGVFRYTKYFTILIIICLFVLFTKKIQSQGNIKLNIVVILLFISFLTSLFITNDINAGRDNGVYLVDSLLINKTNTYIYNDAILATFPGFSNLQNGSTILQFPVGYPLFLAMFHLGHMELTFIVSFVIYFFTLYGIYGISRKLFSHKAAIISILLFATFYTNLWIARNFFSENLTCLLSIGSFYFLLSKDNKLKLFSLIPILASILVRLDSLIYIGVFLLLFIIETIRHRHFISKKWLILVCLVGILIFFEFFYYSIWINSSYLISHLKEVINPIKSFFSNIDSSLMISDVIQIKFPQFYYLFKVFSDYFLIILIILALYGLFKYLRDKFHVKKRYIIYALIFLSPSLFFVIKPMVTIDHPWFMRRFYPIFIPMIIIFASFFFNAISKRVRYLILSAVIIANLVNITPILLFKDYQNSQKSIDQLIKLLPTNAVVIFPSSSWNTFSSYIYIEYGIPSSVEPAYWSWLKGWYPNDLLSKDYILEKFGENKTIFILSKKAPELLETSSSVSNLFSNMELDYINNFKYQTKYIKYSCDFRNEYLNKIADKKLIDEKCNNLPPNEISDLNIDFYMYRYKNFN